MGVGRAAGEAWSGVGSVVSRCFPSCFFWQRGFKLNLSVFNVCLNHSSFSISLHHPSACAQHREVNDQFFSGVFFFFWFLFNEAGFNLFLCHSSSSAPIQSRDIPDELFTLLLVFNWSVFGFISSVCCSVSYRSLFLPERHKNRWKVKTLKENYEKLSQNWVLSRKSRFNTVQRQ